MAKTKMRFPSVQLEKVQALMKPSKATRSARRLVQKCAPTPKRKQPYSIEVKP